MDELIIGLIYNASLLIVLSIAYELSYSLQKKHKKLMIHINGLFIGIIGAAIIFVGYSLAEGLLFDTRSILIASAALLFNPASAIIAALMMTGARIIIGGPGMVMGIATIITSLGTGLIWKRFLKIKKPRHMILNLYLFGIVVHLIMLGCTVFLPPSIRTETFNAVAIPVITIYPVFTVILCLLLIHQRELYENRKLLEESEEKYSALFQNDHTVMLILDPSDHTIVDANPAALRFYGYSYEQITNMKVNQINTMDPAELKELISIAEKEKSNYFNFRHRKASGEEVEVELYSCPVTVNKKKYLFSIIHDISARIKAEKQRIESEEKFRTLVEGAPDAVYIEVEGRFTYLNRAALKLLGFERKEELIGTDIMDRIPSEYNELIEERLRILNVENKPVEPHEHPYIRRDGGYVWLDVAAVPFEMEGKPGAIVFARDISIRKKLQKQTLEFEKQSRQHQKLEAIGTLAGGVAHEINNPLNGILNYAEIIMDQSEGNPEIDRYAKEIVEETERISRIVKNLLEFSRQEKESHSYANIEDIVEKTISLIKAIFVKEQIEIRVNLQEDMPRIKCRSEQIQQVIMNLITNSRHALNEKYPGYDKRKVIEVSGTQFERDDRHWIRITVTDSGVGIPGDNMDKIFEPFFSTKGRDKGTGLGLSVSYGIIRDHHGIIEVDSKEGEYSKFIVELPVDTGWEPKRA